MLKWLAIKVYFYTFRLGHQASARDYDIFGSRWRPLGWALLLASVLVFAGAFRYLDFSAAFEASTFGATLLLLRPALSITYGSWGAMKGAAIALGVVALLGGLYKIGVHWIEFEIALSLAMSLTSAIALSLLWSLARRRFALAIARITVPGNPPGDFAEYLGRPPAHVVLLPLRMDSFLRPPRFGSCC